MAEYWSGKDKGMARPDAEQSARRTQLGASQNVGFAWYEPPNLITGDADYLITGDGDYLVAE